MNKWILFKGYDRRNPFTLLDTANPKSWKVDYSIEIDDFDSPIYYKWNKKKQVVLITCLRSLKHG